MKVAEKITVKEALAKTKTLTKYGIADAHGIESYFTRDANNPSEFIMFIRAESNRQRHAVVYFVEVDEKTDNKMNELLKQNKFIEALLFLKAHAKKLGFPKDRVDLYSKSWDLIPNPKLDPWH